MGETSIAWTHMTFNPWWGCTRVSPGCENCYAETFSHRLGLDLWGPRASRRFFDDKHWNEPLKWARRRANGDPRHLVFCASMADVFEDRRSLDESRHRLWNLIEATPELTWQLLTKRPEHIDKLAPGAWTMGRWPANVWMLVTAEDQERADLRIPILLRTGAGVKGVSYEPALGPVDFRRWLPVHGSGWDIATCTGVHLDWLIVGGESGPGARPCDLAWIRSVRDQCREAGTAFFFKQAGSNARDRNDAGFEGDTASSWPMDTRHTDIDRGYQGAEVRIHTKDRKGGDMAEWPADLRVREMPDA